MPKDNMGREPGAAGYTGPAKKKKKKEKKKFKSIAELRGYAKENGYDKGY